MKILIFSIIDKYRKYFNYKTLFYDNLTINEAYICLENESSNGIEFFVNLSKIILQMPKSLKLTN